MLITVIIFAASFALLCIYLFKALRVNKAIKAQDAEIREALTKEGEIDKDALIDMYNKRAELDSDIVEFNKNAVLMTVITIIVGIITVIAACILHVPT